MSRSQALDKSRLIRIYFLSSITSWIPQCKVRSYLSKGKSSLFSQLSVPFSLVNLEMQFAPEIRMNHCLQSKHKKKYTFSLSWGQGIGVLPPDRVL